MSKRVALVQADARQVLSCSVNTNSFVHMSMLLLSGVEPCPIPRQAVTHIKISVVRKHFSASAHKG
jgi:hypothetical protein